MLGVPGFPGAVSLDDERLKLEFRNEAPRLIFCLGFPVPHDDVHGLPPLCLDGMFHRCKGDPAHVCHGDVVEAADREIIRNFVFHIKRASKIPRATMSL